MAIDGLHVYQNKLSNVHTQGQDFLLLYYIL